MELPTLPEIGDVILRPSVKLAEALSSATEFLDDEIPQARIEPKELIGAWHKVPPSENKTGQACARPEPITPCHILPTSDFRLPTSDFRLPTSDCPMPDA